MMIIIDQRVSTLTILYSHHKFVSSNYVSIDTNMPTHADIKYVHGCL